MSTMSTLALLGSLLALPLLQQDAPPQSYAEIAASIASDHRVLTVPPRDGKTKGEIAKSDRRYPLRSGASPVLLIELPSIPRAFTLAIASLCNCGGPLKSVFLANLQFLDGQFAATHDLAWDGFPKPTENMFSDYQGSLRATFDVDGTTASDRYVLIYTDAAKIGGRFGTLTISEGLMKKSKFPYFGSDHGTIEVEISSKTDR